MILAIPKEDILKLLKLQLNNFFLLNDFEIALLDRNFELALKKCEFCFSQNTNKYYFKEEQVYFNPYHSVQYMMFLYFLSNIIYRKYTWNESFCDKIYYLNKVMNGVDIHYAVELPDFFKAEHPVGSVMGRARYGNGFVFYQNCSVGGIHLSENKIIYPRLGMNVKMFASSMILGDCEIGDNVNIGAGTLVKNQNIPSNVNVFGQSPNLIIKSIPSMSNE